MAVVGQVWPDGHVSASSHPSVASQAGQVSVAAQGTLDLLCALSSVNRQCPPLPVSTEELGPNRHFSWSLLAPGRAPLHNVSLTVPQPGPALSKHL